MNPLALSSAPTAFRRARLGDVQVTGAPTIVPVAVLTDMLAPSTTSFVLARPFSADDDAVLVCDHAEAGNPSGLAQGAPSAVTEQIPTESTHRTTTGTTALDFPDSTPTQNTDPSVAAGSRASTTRMGGDDPCQVPTRAEYARRVAQARDLIQAGTVNKVVLGRRMCLAHNTRLDMSAQQELADRIVDDLISLGTQGFPVLMPLPGERTLVGLSPELLIRRHGFNVEAFPLAGSAPRSGHEDIDAPRRHALMNSAKDRSEHAFVVADIVRSLTPLCSHIDAPEVPEVVEAATMLHLGTHIRGTLRPREDGSIPTLIEVAEALHPTPAVCGSPTPVAQRIIEDLEEPRGLFTGYIAAQDTHGDGQAVIAIRMALLDRDGITLYAGAGIVADSDPDAEADETHGKLRTVLNAIAHTTGSGV
ncbi:isochorismate synthase [Devriesea agamarum]|uniref:isochorismate synthase n=1 Tax=Devriesea agamarum TaxID=472569 RepID=UPI00071D59CA|nr:chorismate-binding protein [Devriesea agamarum]